MLIYIAIVCIGFVLLVYGIQSIRKGKETEEKTKKDVTKFRAPLPPPYPNWSVKTTKPLPYRPFKYGPNYFVTMGISRISFDDWIELDNEWPRYHHEKLNRLSSDRASSLCKTAPEALDAARETMELLSEYLVARYPSLFRMETINNVQHIRITTTNEVYPIVSEDPLKYASLLLEEDLALMIEGDDQKYYLKAGSIILPGFWRLEDKFNMSLADIHLSGDVPKFKEKLQTSMERFFLKLKPEEMVTRYNYFIQTDENLAWSQAIGSEDEFGIGWDNAQVDPPIEKIHFRSERQTLRRLPRSRAILFTIRTYFIPVVEIAKEPGVPERLASAIRSWPDDVSRYKGKHAYGEILLEYLDKMHDEQVQNNNHMPIEPRSYPY